MISALTIIQSESTDIYRHLALEEYLFQRIEAHQAILYLWRSQDVVVMGKNQNPWGECPVTALASLGIRLARRSSGGGTVYHDRGNLNFTFISTTEHYSLQQHFAIIIAALKLLGIHAHWDQRHALLVNNKKISGNAFRFRKNLALHHGTLLLDADLIRLQQVLMPATHLHFESLAVASVPSAVRNLTEINPNLSWEATAEKIIESFISAHSHCEVHYKEMSDYPHIEVNEIHQKFSSWAWIFGETPKFSVHWVQPFNGGEISVSMTVAKAVISELLLSLPASYMKLDVIERVQTALIGCPFNSQIIADQLRSLIFQGTDQAWLHELINLIASKEF